MLSCYPKVTFTELYITKINVYSTLQYQKPNFGQTQPIKAYNPYNFGHFTCFGIIIWSPCMVQFGHLFSVIYTILRPGLFFWISDKKFPLFVLSTAIATTTITNPFFLAFGKKTFIYYKWPLKNGSV